MGSDSEECLSLSQKELNKSLSAMKKKKKRSFRPVLMSPFPPPFKKVQEDSGDLKTILERNLAIARLCDEAANPSADSTVDPKKARAELALGINAVYRHLHKSNVSAVVVASDIQPESLVSHVVVKCHRDGVPLLRVSELRSITKQTLGFECIAVGFLKTSELFKTVIDCVKKQCPTVVAVPRTDVVETGAVANLEKPVACEEPPERVFQYRKRSDPKTRSFIPETYQKEPSKTQPTSESDFISLSSQEFTVDQEIQKGISSTILKRRRKLKDPAEEEEIDLIEEVLPKKLKKSWVIDPVGERVPWMGSYSSPHVARIGSNVERREKPKKQKNKKGKQ